MWYRIIFDKSLDCYIVQRWRWWLPIWISISDTISVDKTKCQEKFRNWLKPELEIISGPYKIE